MSFQAIAAVIHHSKASPGAKMVLTIVANFDGDEGAWCSQATIAKLANVSVRQVRRYLEELESLNELQTWLHEGNGFIGSRKTNRYYIVLDCPEGCDGTFNHRVQADTYGTPGGHIRPTRRTHMADEADIYVPLTSNEPVKNQKQPIKLSAVS